MNEVWPELYASEETMCREFWKLILGYRQAGKIHEFDIYHNSNNQRIGGRAGVIKQQKDKMMGVVAGVADYTVVGYGYLEAKIYTVKDGKITKTYLNPRQKRFRERVLQKGLKFDEFRTPREGINILEQWGVL